MIKRVEQIRSVGKFVACKPVGDVEFRRVNLIFGENGRGKSTLTAILRSLQTGNVHLVNERATLKGTEKPLVHLRMQDNSLAKFNSGAWSTHHPDIEIFDATFVYQNVYAGLYVDHEQKKGLYRVIIGDKGIALNEQVIALNADVKRVNGEIDLKEAEIKKHINDGLELSKFVDLIHQPELDEKIAAKELEVAAIKSAAEIASKTLLTQLQLPDVPDIAPLLLKELADLSREAESAVESHVKEHLGEGGEQWIATGLDYLKDGEPCPFCGQKLENVDLIRSYQVFFSERYKQLKVDIATAASGLEKLFGDKALLKLQKVVDDNAKTAAWWERFVSLKLDDFPTEDMIQSVQAVKDALSAVLLEKAASPLESLALGAVATAAVEKYKVLVTLAEKYNASITAANALIEQKKKDTSVGSLKDAQRDLSILNNTKRRHDPAVDTLCGEHATLVAEKTAFTKRKNEAKKDLDSHASSIFASYETALNKYLDLFGADFRIGGTKGQYPGGTASTHYCIYINGEEIELGDTTTPNGTPCFRCTLSGSDKSALALAFFMARLEHDDRLADKMVVFDDPVSSMDGNRALATAQEIAKLAQKAKRTIVLSHESFFLRKLYDEVHPPSDIRTLHLCRVGDDTGLMEWDIHEATQSAYLQDFFGVAEYIEKGPKSTAHSRSVAVKIRLVLEEYLRTRFPQEFTGKKWLGDFISAIRASKAGDPLFHMQKSLSELDAINSYSSPYHHSNPNWAREPINDTTLKTYAGRTLTFVRVA